MQLNGCAEGSSTESQGIPFGSSPRAPFDNYSEAEGKQLLTQLPLQRFDLTASFFLPEA